MKSFTLTDWSARDVIISLITAEGDSLLITAATV